MSSDPVDLAPGTFAPLRVPEYRRVWGGAVVSHVGTFLQLVAAPWLMNELTGSPLMVALVTSALWLPRLALTVPAGVLADVFDRRNLLIAAQLFNAATVTVLAVLAWRGDVTPGALLTLSLVLGMGSAVALPAYQTLLPDLVPVPLLANAVTLNSAAFNVARALGPSIGGALVAVGLTPLAFFINAGSYLVVIVMLLTIPREITESSGRQPMLRSAAAGMRYARFTHPIRVALAVTGAFALTAASVQSLLPSVVSDDLGLGAAAFGLLYGSFGAGALVGAVSRERGRRLVPGNLVLPVSIAGFGLGGVAFGLSRSPLLSGIALALAGLFWVWTMTTLNASIQMLAPRWVRGRVMSLYVMAAGLQPIGAFAAGVIAELAGAGVAVAIMTGGTAVLGLYARRLTLPILEDIVAPAPPDDWTMAAHPVRVGGSPVSVVTTWEIDPDDAPAFFAAMRELRRQRLRTGARRWSLYRDAGEPYRISESWEVYDWDEHLAQHQRIDGEAAAAIRHARSFDRSGGPTTRHLAGIDLLDLTHSIEDQLLTVHEEFHELDGSTPLSKSDDRPDGPATPADNSAAQADRVDRS
jgi:MFS family permease